MSAIGSMWHSWDLHIHTPASFHWKGKKFHEQDATEKEATCKSIVERLNAADQIAFGIMDYWTFDGFFILRDYITANPNATNKVVFPGIELRLEAATDFRLNTHVLFDPSLSVDRLNQFLARLSIGGPNGSPPSRETFIAIGRGYDGGKLARHGFRIEDREDDEKMYRVGVQTAEVTRESLIRGVDFIGEKNCLIIQPYDTSDGLEGLDWKRHPYNDSTLMKMAHIFEARDQVHVQLFLGHGYPAKPSVGQEFIDNIGGYPKPVISGSDAHRINDYGIYPSGRVTWLKAQPTFAGLRQVCCEPARRCFIGTSPPKRDHVGENPTKYIQAIRISKIDGATLAETWFDNVALKLNPGLIAIIGNKGSGKSALADIVALAGNTHCQEMEFLNAKRFRRGSNPAKQFACTLTWADGTEAEVNLGQVPDEEKPERVRYLPQQVIENLCNEISGGGSSNFEQEIKKVIFAYLPKDRQLQKSTLDELIDYVIETRKTALGQLRAKVRSLNAEIATLEESGSHDAIKALKSSLALKQNELEAHDKSRPAEEMPPAADPANLEAARLADRLTQAQAAFAELKDRRESAGKERTALTKRGALLGRLLDHVDNFAKTYSTFVKDRAAEFEEAGLDIADIVQLTVRRELIGQAQQESSQSLANATSLLDGSGGEKGLQSLTSEAEERIKTLQGELAAPQKRYQDYLSELKRWQDRRAEIVGSAETAETIVFFKSRIENAENVVPNRLVALKRQREEYVRDIHRELLSIRQTFQELYEPVQSIVKTSEFVSGELQLEFNAFIGMPAFAEKFMEFIHRRRKGNFYGEEESKKLVNDLIEECDFNETEAVVGFLERLMSALTSVDRDGVKETITVQSQLKQTKKPVELLNFMYCLDYMEPRYTLKLGDKDIVQLSPGEKGALLLVFYLLLDREEIPIIIDQPEHNLDNESVVKLLVDCIREASARRQVIIVTHNPNLAVFCDADQIVCTEIDKTDGNKVTYKSGAIEDFDINKITVDILEGTYRAFDNRQKKYHRPDGRFSRGLPIKGNVS